MNVDKVIVATFVMTFRICDILSDLFVSVLIDSSLFCAVALNGIFSGSIKKKKSKAEIIM